MLVLYGAMHGNAVPANANAVCRHESLDMATSHSLTPADFKNVYSCRCCDAAVPCACAALPQMLEASTSKGLRILRCSYCMQNMAAVAKISEMAKARGVTAGQLALAWVHSRGDDVIPIPGTLHPSHPCVCPKSM